MPRTKKKKNSTSGLIASHIVMYMIKMESKLDLVIFCDQRKRNK